MAKDAAKKLGEIGQAKKDKEEDEHLLQCAYTLTSPALEGSD